MLYASATFSLGVDQANATDLAVQPLKIDHTPNGPAITTGITSDGQGVFPWYAAVPTGTTQAKLYRTGDATVFSVRGVTLTSGGVVVVTPPPENQPTGYYGGLDDVYAAGGSVNVQRYSQLDKKVLTPDMARIQRVMSQVDDYITAYLSRNGIARPAPGSPGFSMLTWSFAWRTLLWLYRARGDTQQDSEQFGHISSRAWDADADSLMLQYATGERQDLTKQVRIDTGGNGTPASSTYRIIP